MQYLGHLKLNLPAVLFPETEAQLILSFKAFLLYHKIVTVFQIDKYNLLLLT